MRNWSLEYAWLLERLSHAFGREAIMTQENDYGREFAVGVRLVQLDGDIIRYAMTVEGRVHSHKGNCELKSYIDDEGIGHEVCTLPLKPYSLNQSLDRDSQVEQFINAAFEKQLANA